MMEASLTTGEAGENFLLVMWAPLHFVVCLFCLFVYVHSSMRFPLRSMQLLGLLICS
jgi:hypothetical protein